MIIDKTLEFSDAQALTATAASTNSIDLTVARDVGVGMPLYINVTVDVALAGTSPTFQVSVQTDDNSAFSSPTTKFLGPVFSTAPAGTVMAIPVPRDVLDERFARLNYVMGGTTPTVTVSAHVSGEQGPDITSYPDGVTYV